jgi:hypothetical protein
MRYYFPEGSQFHLVTDFALYTEWIRHLCSDQVARAKFKYLYTQEGETSFPGMLWLRDSWQSARSDIESEFCLKIKDKKATRLLHLVKAY